MNLKNFNINNYSSLFLDRDGVINRRVVNDYVRDWNQFELLPGVLEAMSLFSAWFNHIIIVSNQQGVEKGLMSKKDVNKIHQMMKEEIVSCGGRVDGAYVATELASLQPLRRKPGIGMIMEALFDFPGIQCSKAIMVGDADSDILLGRKLGMVTVRIRSEKGGKEMVEADLSFNSLLEMAMIIKNIKL